MPASPERSDLLVPDPDYVLTLDADSVLLPEYCLRLVHLLEQSEHRQTAIAQTPVQLVPRARRPGSSGSPAPPPTCSTSCTRG